MLKILIFAELVIVARFRRAVKRNSTYIYLF